MQPSSTKKGPSKVPTGSAVKVTNDSTAENTTRVDEIVGNAEESEKEAGAALEQEDMATCLTTSSAV